MSVSKSKKATIASTAVATEVKKVRKPRAKKVVEITSDPTILSKSDIAVLQVIEEKFPEVNAKLAAIEAEDAKMGDCVPRVAPGIFNTNKSLLRGIGASDGQVDALHQRTFSSLPLWVRKRLKRQFRKVAEVQWRELKKDRQYHFLRHVGKEELIKLAHLHPAPRRAPLLVRDEETARVLFGKCV
jgi:hypothetical protein